MLKIENCSFSYYKKKFIIKNFSYEFKPCTKTFLIGQSGSGKSTILKLLAKILNHENGNIFYNEKNIKKIIFFNYIKNICRYNSQFPSFLESLNITEYFQLISQNKINFEYDYLLDFITSIFGKEILKTNLRNLSGGQSKTISLVSCLINKAEIYLLDEPTSNIDEKNSEIIYNFVIENIFKMNKNSTLIISTHDKKLIDKTDKIIYLNDTF
jgi:ABC-type lipoprotein export system ATPase subunit